MAGHLPTSPTPTQESAVPNPASPRRRGPHADKHNGGAHPDLGPRLRGGAGKDEVSARPQKTIPLPSVGEGLGWGSASERGGYRSHYPLQTKKMPPRCGSGIFSG